MKMFHSLQPRESWKYLFVLAVFGIQVEPVTAQPTSPPPKTPVNDPPPGDLDYSSRLVPKGWENRWLEKAWSNLNSPEPESSRALLELAKRPNEVLPFLRKKLVPLKVEEQQVKKWIQDLGNKELAVWWGAFENLSYYDPLLVMDAAKVLALAEDPVVRRRLATALLNFYHPDSVPEGRITLVKEEDGVCNLVITPENATDKKSKERVFRLPQKPYEFQHHSWVRTAKAIVLLEHIGGPEALAILKEMATGHADTLPTISAKNAIVELMRPAP